MKTVQTVLRDEPEDFARLMRKKLELPKNAAKAHWSELTNDQLLFRLREEVLELSLALEEEKSTPEDIMLECADVGNIAMMIADNAKKGLG